MAYPTLSQDGVSRFVTEVLIRADIEQSVVDEFLADHAESIDSLDLASLEAAGRSLFDTAIEAGITDKKLEPIENEFSGRVYDAMAELPLEALGDIGFWSYCAAKCFWGFITLRQRSSVLEGRRRIVRSLVEVPAEDADERPLPLNRYVLGKDHYQIPLRLFLRAQAVGGDQEFLDDHLLPEGTDFWRSHVLAVRTGAYPNWARPLVAAQSAQGLIIGQQRPPARSINRLRVNVSPILHDEEEAAAIITPIWVAPPAGEGTTKPEGKVKKGSKSKTKKG